MPHIIIEHSDNFDSNFTKNLILEVHHTLQNSEGNFDINACKGRAVAYQNYLLGNNEAGRDFIHITLKIHTGRSKEIRINLAKIISEKIKLKLENYKKTEGLKNKTDFTISINEIDSDIYQKSII